MVTISNLVQDILDKQILLQEAISQKIISYQKLSDYIKPELEKKLGKKPKNSAMLLLHRRPDVLPAVSSSE